MEQNPWKKTGSRLVYQNPWITLREDQVVCPDGSPGIYSVVESRVATGVVALTPDDKLYLVGQYRYPVEEYSWEIIEGGADDGESALDAAKRELQEEAGLTAEHWEPLGGEIHTSNCIAAERAYLFVATGLHHVGATPESTEILQLQCVSIDEALKMIERGLIKDAMSIIALFHLARTRR